MKRDIAADVVKGLCVVVMVVHHSLDYFPAEHMQLKYVRFVSAAFLFMAGYVATHVYYTKYDLVEDWRKVSRRLVWRGIKLLLICLFANASIAVLLGEARMGGMFWITHLVYLLLTGLDYRAVSFDLLVPIAYVLIANGILVALERGGRKGTVVLSIALVTYCSAFHFEQVSGYYLRFFSIGMLGSAAGLLDDKKVHNACSNLSRILLLFFCQLLFIPFTSLNYPFYILNTVITVSAMYGLAINLNKEETIARVLVSVGQHTLFSYLFQILVLRCLQVLFLRDCWPQWNALLALFVTLTITVGAALVIDPARKRYRLADTMYKSLFH